jgi:V8-like Glu-specific endopeptidase
MARANPALSVKKTVAPAPHDPALAPQAGFAPNNPKHPVSEHDPYRLSVAKIWCFAPGDPNPRGAGSAVFIASDVLLTVGHVLFDPAEYGSARDHGYVDHVRITSPWFPIPAAAAETKRVVVTPGWARPHPRRDGDLGVVRLNAPVGGIDPLIPQAASNSDLQGQKVAVYGYPSVSQQLYQALGTCVALETQFVYHTADASRGESGSPLLADLPTGAALVGLHRAGMGETPNGIPPSVSASG